MVLRLACVVLPASIVACGGESSVAGPDDGSSDPDPTVEVAPDSAALTAVDDTAHFTAGATDSSGTAVADSAVTWSVSDTLLASVDGSGVVTAREPGEVRVTATFRGASDDAVVTVDPEVERVAVTPATDSLVENRDTVQLSAEARDANGHPTGSGPFTWSSSDTTVATVDTTGRVHAREPGEAEIAAETRGVSGTADLVVEEIPGNDPPIVSIRAPEDGAVFDASDTVSLAAIADDDEDGELTESALQWRSDLDGPVGEGRQHRAADLSAGTHVLTVEATDSEGATDTDTVDVTVNTAASLSVAELRPHRRGIRSDRELRAGALVRNTGGSAYGPVGWSFRLDGRQEASGRIETVEGGETVEVPVQSLGRLAAGDHVVEFALDPEGRIPDARKAKTTARDVVVSYAGGTFDIELVFESEMSEERKEVVREAARRMEEVVTADLPDERIPDWGGCPEPHGGRMVDDVLVTVAVDTMDGSGGTLARGGFCVVRSSGRDGRDLTALLGGITFDAEDLQRMDEEGFLFDVALHEIGHALGIGMWGNHRDVVELDADDPYFRGTLARTMFDSVGGESYSGNKVPLDETSTGHWREPVLGDEVMTPFLSHDGNPLSEITVGALGDLYYPVDTDRADAYELPAARGIRAVAPGDDDGLHLGDDRAAWTVYSVSPSGRVERVQPPEGRR